MRRVVLVAIAVVAVLCSGQAYDRKVAHIVLPSPKLLRCVSADCSQLWEDDRFNGTSIYPRQITVDFHEDKSCPIGIMARYDKSVSLQELRAALDEKYGKWADSRNATLPVKLWRVESEKFAIQLSTIDKREALSQLQAAGTRTVIYLAFAPAQCDSK